jgi:hypothetical protein
VGYRLTRQAKTAWSARPGMAKWAAPAAAATAPTAQATRGGPVPAAGTPLVAAATSSRTATPTAVPSCAAVLTMPDAPPRQRGPTSVPRPVAATDDSPMPTPAAAAHSGTVQALAGDQISTPSANAIMARPSATTSGDRWWRCATADRLAPAMTARLNGIRAAAA